MATRTTGYRTRPLPRRRPVDSRSAGREMISLPQPEIQWLNVNTPEPIALNECSAGWFTYRPTGQVRALASYRTPDALPETTSHAYVDAFRQYAASKGWQESTRPGLHDVTWRLPSTRCTRCPSPSTRCHPLTPSTVMFRPVLTASSRTAAGSCARRLHPAASRSPLCQHQRSPHPPRRPSTNSTPVRVHHRRRLARDRPRVRGLRLPFAGEVPAWSGCVSGRTRPCRDHVIELSGEFHHAPVISTARFTSGRRQPYFLPVAHRHQRDDR